MNVKLILGLSLVGLAIALGDVFFIPIILEPVVWLAVYLYFAYAIASGRGRRRFANGFLLGLLVSLWITATQVLFLERYLAKHTREVEMIAMLHAAHISGTARQVMAVTGPLTGVFVGLLLGFFAVIAGMMTKPRHVELFPVRPQ